MAGWLDGGSEGNPQCPSKLCRGCWPHSLRENTPGESWVSGGGEWGDRPFSFGKVYLKVPAGLLCLDIHQVLGQRGLQGDNEFKDAVECPGSDCCSQRKIWPCWLQFSSHFPWYLTSDLFSKCLAGSSSFSLKCGFPREFHHPSPFLCIHQSFLCSPEFLCSGPMKAHVCNHFQEKRGSCSMGLTVQGPPQRVCGTLSHLCVFKIGAGNDYFLFLWNHHIWRPSVRIQICWGVLACMYSTSSPSLNPARTFLKVVKSPFIPTVSFSFHQELNQPKVE